MNKLPTVTISARVARAIDQRLTSWRVEMRGLDAELDQTLQALHEAGLQWRGFLEEVRSTSCRPIAEAGSTSGESKNGEDVTVAQAADLLDLGHRAVRRAALEGRLVGEQRGNRWVFERQAVEDFRRRRPA